MSGSKHRAGNGYTLVLSQIRRNSDTSSYIRRDNAMFKP